MTKVYSKCFDEIGAFNDTRYIVGMLEKVTRLIQYLYSHGSPLCFLNSTVTDSAYYCQSFAFVYLFFFLEIDCIDTIVRALCVKQRSELIFKCKNCNISDIL